ncbi:MAG: non-canonical purine NTP pyrophosphatase, RdgB/HAM1 family [Thermoprotei archaeon]|nr:MAG: non-canonical purine NTP pyrophosphatase, RdgB/HAM1 family [Thermoprotei archaeon]RLF18127.1 MAG: non-canonical purine NTP pyrophosphatase, RdgB/HAM1 family [Thermoprotei archaeon]
MYELIFVTSNPHKVREVKEIVERLAPKVNVKALNLELKERQLDSVEEIAEEAVKEAFKLLGKPVMVEDAGMFIDALNGFPGPYSSYVFKTIGNKGILRLMEGIENRKATFKSAIAFCSQEGLTLIFTGTVKGEISLEERGEGWGFDPIFIPEEGGGKTYAELGPLKNEISHRRRALEKLATWLSSTLSP